MGNDDDPRGRRVEFLVEFRYSHLFGFDLLQDLIEGLLNLRHTLSISRDRFVDFCREGLEFFS
jgi:hypothetical protein